MGVMMLYQLLYNFGQTIGWSYILYLTVLELVQTGGRYENVYDRVEEPLKIFQTLAVLEIFHAMFGIVKSPLGTTLTQVFSRVMLVWGVTNAVPEVQSNIAFTLMVLAWSITEVIRYGYYGFSLLGNAPYFLLWCRYTFFYVLYPLGVTGELLMIFFSLPYVAEKGIYSTSMPNWYNFSFNYYYFLILAMLTYIPGFPPLYKYMIKQRKLKLGEESADSRKKAH